VWTVGLTVRGSKAAFSNSSAVVWTELKYSPDILRGKIRLRLGH